MKRTVLLLAVLLPSSPLLAQGLGDTAARERQKRAEKPPAAPAKVFTDEDLPKAAAPGEARAAADKAKSSPGAPAGKDVSSREAPGASETEAQPRAGDLAGERGESAVSEPADPYEKERQERKLLEAEWRVRFANAREQLAIAEANSWQEVVRTQLYQGIPVQMKVKEQTQTSELKQARQALADLTEEFRHTGFPPGWARE